MPIIYKRICNFCGKYYEGYGKFCCSNKCRGLIRKGTHCLFSEEHKRKLSENHKGMLGKHHSEETRKKLSKLFRGRKFSKEWKRKLSEALKGEKNGSYKGGRRKNSLGYILILSPNHPFKNSQGYVLEHRLIVEKILGRYLLKTEFVHHINGIKNDNRSKNLYLFPSFGKHISYENLKNKPLLISNLLFKNSG